MPFMFIQLPRMVSNINGAQNNFSSAGIMKISSDGKKIADVITEYIHTLQVFHFNDSTGRVSNTVLVDSEELIPFYFSTSYGISFSPNSNLLYAAAFSPDSSIYQYNLIAGDSDAVLSSRLIVGHSHDPWSMQLAPDKRIYIAEYFDSTLDVIKNPDVPGLGCNFERRGFKLAHSMLCQLGLPNFPDSYFSPSKSDGTEEIIKDLKLEVSPVPARDFCFLQVTNATRGMIGSVINVTGQQLFQFEIVNLKTKFSISNLPSGLYFLKVIDELGNSGVAKFVKQ